jgi:hypothetical protein
MRRPTTRPRNAAFNLRRIVFSANHQRVCGDLQEEVSQFDAPAPRIEVRPHDDSGPEYEAFYQSPTGISMVEQFFSRPSRLPWRAARRIGVLAVHASGFAEFLISCSCIGRPCSFRCTPPKTAAQPIRPILLNANRMGPDRRAGPGRQLACCPTLSVVPYGRGGGCASGCLSRMKVRSTC